MRQVLRRNLSSNARVFRRANALVVSVPKSGRTWVRVLVHHYLSEIEKIPFVLDGTELQSRGLPNLIFTHDLWEHLTTRSFKDRLRGKYLIPEGLCRRKPILLLARDPRDVIVSLYFQLTKRTIQFQGTLSEMVRDETYGIHLIVEVMNAWLALWARQNNFKLLRYEDCRSHPSETFGSMIRFMGFAMDHGALERSIEFASFENMKQMETQGRFQSGVLRVKDSADVEAFKVRRGIVGGYGEYLNSADLTYVETALEKLDSRYGYSG